MTIALRIERRIYYDAGQEIGLSLLSRRSRIVYRADAETRRSVADRLSCVVLDDLARQPNWGPSVAWKFQALTEYF